MSATETAMKTRARAVDHILLKLHADGRTEVLVLTQVHPGTRRRIRQFARAVIESPSFPSLTEAAV